MCIVEKVRQNMIYVIYIVIFFVIYSINSMVPLCYGDDYLYSFIWDESVNQGNMFHPISEDARRVNSFEDIFYSQWSHYFTWGGRTPAHILVQFFLWQGKELFNLANALVFLLLLMEIAWLSMGGNITLKIPVRRMLWIFFVVWTFTPDFCPIMLWLTGSCNYLWMIVIVLAFLLPWVRWYFHGENNSIKILKTIYMLAFGILAGWTNENTICWIILILAFVIWKMMKKKIISYWMISGWIGLCMGYSFMMLAPGNYARQAIEASLSDISDWELFHKKLIMLFFVFFIQFILWYFIIRALTYYRKIELDEVGRKWLKLVKIYSFLSFASLFIMMCSPAFPIRSGFGSSVFLFVAGGMILQLEQNLHSSYLPLNAKKMMHVVGIFYLGITLIFSLINLHQLKSYAEYVDREAKNAIDKNQDVIILSGEKRKRFEFLDTHYLNISLNQDPCSWSNVAYARYWGIRSISTTNGIDSLEEN